MTPAQFATWIGSGDTGVSSKSIAIAAMGGEMPKTWGWGYPSDPADFGRCARLLKKFPEIRELAFARLRKEGPRQWVKLIDKWDQIEAAMESEVGIDWSKGKRASQTYDLMQLILKSEKGG